MALQLLRGMVYYVLAMCKRFNRGSSGVSSFFAVWQPVKRACNIAQIGSIQHSLIKVVKYSLYTTLTDSNTKL